MCGFVAYFGSGSNYWWEKINAMSNLINHRGPDNKGFHFFSFDKGINFPIIEDDFNSFQGNLEGYLAFNRLSIQDLSQKGNQPMISAKYNVGIVFNGEIYNTNYLRKLLKDKGYYFDSKSDTEVLLFLYIEYGLDRTLELIDGMYAFSIVDMRSNRIYLVRDHVGIKPLYYFFKNDKLIFSSELKVFKLLNEYKWKLNYKKISEQIMFRNIIGDETLINNIYQLKPGHYHIYSFSGNHINKKSEKNYYNLPKFQNNPIVLNKNLMLETKLKEIIKSQLISDVSLGTQLSGGIDSSLVTLFASKEKNNLETFSINVNDDKLSEKKYIDFINDFLKVKNNIFEIDDNCFIEALDKVSFHLDHPIHHPNTIGLFFLSKYSSEKIKVLLSGEGADELFAGYSRYFRNTFGFEFLNKRLRLLNKFIPIKLPFNSLGKHYDKDVNYILSLSYGSNEFLGDFYSQFNFDDAIENRLHLFSSTEGNNFLEKILNYEIKYELPSLLIRQDKMTMAFSIENRVPFLSKELISLVRSNYSALELINNKFNIRSFFKARYNTKLPLKEISNKYFDKKFTYRSKNGFGFPIKRILNSPKLEEKFHYEYLPLLIKFLDVDKNRIKNMWFRKEFYAEEIFTLISFSSWLKNLN